MFEKAKLAEIVGTNNAIFEDAVLKKYAGDMSFTHSIKPACVLKPKNAAEIARIVNLARETLTPLVPVSSGSPNFRGDAIPGTGGGVKESNPDFAAWTADIRLKEARATGAEALVTACPGCEKSFTGALQGRENSFRIYDIVELLARATL